MLERGAKSLPFYESFIWALRTVESFLNDKALRIFFVVTCLGMSTANAEKFKTHQRVHVDWRWEFLSIALAELIPRIGVLATHFNVEAW